MWENRLSEKAVFSYPDVDACDRCDTIYQVEFCHMCHRSFLGKNNVEGEKPALIVNFLWTVVEGADNLASPTGI